MAQPVGGGGADEAYSGREPSKFELKAMIALQRGDLHVKMGDIEDARIVFMKCMKMPSPKKDRVARRLQQMCSVKLWTALTKAGNTERAAEVSERAYQLGLTTDRDEMVMYPVGGLDSIPFHNLK